MYFIVLLLHLISRPMIAAMLFKTFSGHGVMGTGYREWEMDVTSFFISFLQNNLFRKFFKQFQEKVHNVSNQRLPLTCFKNAQQNIRLITNFYSPFACTWNELKNGRKLVISKWKVLVKVKLQLSSMLICVANSRTCSLKQVFLKIVKEPFTTFLTLRSLGVIFQIFYSEV